MNILMLIDSYLPAIGGAQRHVRDLSMNLVDNGHQVSVVTLMNQGLLDFEQDNGVRIYRIKGTMHRFTRLFSNPGRVYSPPFPDLEIVKDLQVVIKKEEPTIIHAHNWLLYSLLPLRKKLNLKVVMTLHGYDLVCPKWMYMYKNSPCTGPELPKCIECASQHFGFVKGSTTVIAKKLISPFEKQAVDMFLPVSQAVADGNHLPKRSLPYQVIPNFVSDSYPSDSAQDDCLQEYYKKLPDEGFLLYVGTLSRLKGVEVLLQAYSLLENPPPLVLIGSTWPDTPKVLPENVTLLKDWPHKAVIGAWSRCGIGIVPSLLPDAFPTVVLEAMMAGRPVIAARSGGIPEEIVDGKTGILVSPGNPVELSVAITFLLKNPDTAEGMGRAGKEKVVEFQARSIVPRIEKVYQQVIGNHA